MLAAEPRPPHVLLRPEGWSLGREQAYRLYCEESPQLRSKRPRRRKMVVGRRERYIAKRPNQAWSMDFVADQLVNGTRFRALTIVDVYTREALAITVGQRLKAEDVVCVCNRLVARRGSTVRIFVDNGSEFSGRVFDLWAYHQKATIDFNRPGKPTDNCFVESFNGSFRDECLNDRPRESHSALLDGYPDLRGVDRRVPPELVEYVLLDLFIRLHSLLLSPGVGLIRWMAAASPGGERRL